MASRRRIRWCWRVRSGSFWRWRLRRPRRRRGVRHGSIHWSLCGTSEQEGHMRTLFRLRSLWRNLVHRERVERDLDDEMRATFELAVEEGIVAGMNRDEARRAAVMRLGRAESLKERIHDVKAGAFAAAFAQDVRHAVRLLRRGPLFAGFAIASLTLGIGATGAIFSLFDAISLRRLPVPEPDRLVLASFASPGRSNYSMPYPQFDAIRQRTTTLAGIFALSPLGRVTVSAADGADAANGVHVSGDYYRTLGLTPALGRLLDAADDRP